MVLTSMTFRTREAYWKLCLISCSVSPEPSKQSLNVYCHRPPVWDMSKVLEMGDDGGDVFLLARTQDPSKNTDVDHHYMAP